VLVGAYVAGPVSGAAFNPAVTFGLGVMGILNVTDAWVHFAGQLAGGMLGVAVAAFTVNRNSRSIES
jgi:aquaporin Z